MPPVSLQRWLLLQAGCRLAFTDWEPVVVLCRTSGRPIQLALPRAYGTLRDLSLRTGDPHKGRMERFWTHTQSQIEVFGISRRAYVRRRPKLNPAKHGLAFQTLTF